MKSIPKIVLLTFLICFGQLSFAGIEPVNARVQGEDLFDLKTSGSSFDISDNKYWIMADGYWDTEFTMKSVKNTVTLGLDESDMTYFGTSFAYKVIVDIEYKQLVGDLLINSVLEDVELAISYNPARGSTYRDRSVYSFSGGLDVHITVQTIEKLVGETWEEVTTSTLPSSLFLETEIISERFYPFDQSEIPSGTTSVAALAGELMVVWPFMEGAEDYELEWTWVNGYAGTVDGAGDPVVLSAATVNYNFDLNATRVRISGRNSYSIPLIYGEGYIAIRYRGVGRGGDRFTIPLEGTWSSVGVGTGESTGILSTYGSSGVTYLYVGAHESNEINYGAGMSFIEGGVRSVGVTYMDGVLKPRQSQAQLNSQDKIIVGSTIYDNYGRPAIGVMSTPVDQTTLGYINDLNMHADGTPYGKQHFDMDDTDPACDQYAAAPPMSSELSSGAANYYSEDNPDKEGANAYLPDANGYPFVQVHYADDPTGRIAKVGGIGPDHQLGEVDVDGTTRDAHYTEYFYTSIENEEIYALFGNDAAAPANYTKVITKDVHGQISVAIIDVMGRTVATYMEGAAPEGLERIEGNSDIGSLVTKNFSEYNVIDDIDGIVQVNAPIVVTDIDKIYSFTYDFTALNFSECLLPEIDLCFDCIYDVDIIIRSEDADCEIEDGAGNVISSGGELHLTYTVGSIEAFDPTSCNGSPFTFSGVNGLEASEFNIQFPKIGTYQIIKVLKVSKTPIDYYWELYKENSTCLLSESFFIHEALTYIDPSDCEDLGPCEMSFLIENGTLEMYLEAHPASVEADYNNLFDTYLADCETMNSCDYLYPILVADFKEGGQYSIKDLIIAKLDGDSYANDLLAALFETLPGGLANWRDLGPFYELDGETESVMYDYMGVAHSAPYTSIALIEFANNWKDSWAENFVSLHPEYCYYTFCAANTGIFDYEHELNSVETFAEACALGLINPFPTSPVDYGSLAGCTLYEDPIYSGGLAAPMISILNEDYEVGMSTLDIYEYAVHICGDDYTTIAFGSGCNADRHWKAFRSLYFSKRFRIIDHLKQTYVDGAGCSDYARSVGITDGPEGDNPFSTRIPRYFDYDSFFFDLDPAFDWAAEAADAEAEVDLMCLDQCEGLATTWMDQLAGCVGYLPLGETWEVGQETFDLVRAKLIEVCAGGCDAEWPFPTQVDFETVTTIPDPGDLTTATFHSFEDVITTILGSETVECSHLLITNPLPSSGTESLLNYLDVCACNLLLPTADAAEFEALYGGIPYDYEAEKCQCDAIDVNGSNAIEGAEVAVLIAAEIFTPNYYPCSSSCVDCQEIATYKASFFSSYGATYSEEPLLFTTYVNEQSYGNYTFASILELIENCDAIDPVLNPGSTPVYHLLDPKTLEIRAFLNKLADTDITADQLDFNQLSLPEYLNSSLYPCEDGDVAAYDYLPTVGASNLSFNIMDAACGVGTCEISLSLPDGVPVEFTALGLGFADVIENIEDFGEIYMLTPLVMVDLHHFYCATTVNVPGGEVITIPVLIDVPCYDFITDHLTEYQSAPSFIICTVDPEPEEDDCLDLLIAEAEITGHENYLEYLASKESEFRANYIATCTYVDETFIMEYEANRYHYTLLHYDQSGNLVKTVSPGGVNPLTALEIEGVLDHIANSLLNPAIYPVHSFETTYKHNSLNQVIEVTTPDGGTSHYFYDNLGRLVVSQNAKQAAFNTGVITEEPETGDDIPAYSYTKYDALGRVIEVGEIIHPTPMTKALAKNPEDLDEWLNQSVVMVGDVGYPIIRNNITQMHYDGDYSAIAAAEFGVDGYGFTRNRITATSVISGYVYPTIPGGWIYPEPDYVNHYRYDIHGNVESYLQEIADLVEYDNRFRKVDYEYDLISGNPNYIYYQKGKADQYIHHYVYDKDNRLKEVYTSDQGQIWDRDVNYEYREDGYLARTEIGEMKVQGMDFAYTLHGWLKTMNSGVLNADFDMGRDGDRDPSAEYSAYENEVHGMVAQDVLAYTVGYYENDYTAISDGMTGFENMQMTNPIASGFNLDRSNLYNGNITSLITNLTDYEGNRLSTTANTYHYDQLHRFKEMHVFSSEAPGGTTNTLAGFTRKHPQTFSITEFNGDAGTRDLGDYEVHVDYDKNGNIKHLIRNAQNITGPDITSSTISDNGMDEFSYIYEASTNKLTQVTDNNDNEVLTIDGDPVNFGDIKSGQGTDNYVYYPDGSLKSDLDEEIAYIDWYPSGKIKRIYRTEASEQSDLYFEYDPMGIRTLKVEMTRTGTVLNTPNLWEYSYYAGDANGTTLAIYELNVNDQDNTLQKTETMLYGGSRLGIDVNHVTVSGLSIDPTLGCNTDGRASFMLQLTGPSLGQPSQDIVISLAGVELANMPNWGGGSGAIGDLITLINSSGAGVEATVISAAEDAGIYTALIEITESYAGTFAEGALVAHSVGGAYVTITTEREFTAGECYSSRDLGMKYYEITNHLGNVMEVVSDRKITVDNATFDALTGNLVSATSDGIIDYFEADVVQYSDYYPYGMTMPGRNGSVSEKYRYAFNGMETDQEVSGSGNSYTTQFRQYDPRLGRWKSLDPLMHLFASVSPYNAFGNNPILYTDPYGLAPTNGKGDVPKKKASHGGGHTTFEQNPEGPVSRRENSAYTVEIGTPGTRGTDANGRTYVYLDFDDVDLDNVWSVYRSIGIANNFTLDNLYEWNPGLIEHKNNLANGQKIYTNAPSGDDPVQDPPITTTVQDDNPPADVNESQTTSKELETWDWDQFARDFFREGVGPIVATDRLFTGDASSTYNYENSLYGTKGFYGNGGKLFVTVVATILSGGSYMAASGTIGITLASSGLIVSLDDLTGAIHGGSTLLEAIAFELGGEEFVKGLQIMKFSVSFVGGVNGSRNIAMTLADGSEVVAVWSVVSQAFTTVRVVKTAVVDTQNANN